MNNPETKLRKQEAVYKYLMISFNFKYSDIEHLLLSLYSELKNLKKYFLEYKGTYDVLKDLTYKKYSLAEIFLNEYFDRPEIPHTADINLTVYFDSIIKDFEEAFKDFFNIDINSL